MRLVTNTILVTCLLGCAHQSHKQVAAGQARAIDVAKEAVASRESKAWARGATYDAGWRGDAWSVMICSKPSYPGDFRIVRVDGGGKLVEYYVGNR